MLHVGQVRRISSIPRIRLIGTLSDKQVIADARRMTGEPDDSSYIPSDPREFCNRIFHTCYMGTENSSVETRRRAKQLAEAIGRFLANWSSTIPRISLFSSYHTDLNMDSVVTSVRNLFALVTGLKPQFRSQGGSSAENLALQNIQVCAYIFPGCTTTDCTRSQARLRMVIAYLFAQLLPWVRGKVGGLLVLGSANVDERSVDLMLCSSRCS